MTVSFAPYAFARRVGPVTETVLRSWSTVVIAGVDPRPGDEVEVVMVPPFVPRREAWPFTIAARPPRCECSDRTDPRYHGGQAECPREAADHGAVVASPALCLPCLHGCEL